LDSTLSNNIHVMRKSLLLRQSLLVFLALLAGGFHRAVVAQGTYTQSADSLGLVVIQAEDFAVNKDGTGIKTGDLWVFATDTAGFLGDGYMQSVMTAGDGDINNAENFNAKLTYQVDFVKTGTHYLWGLVFFPSASGDSFFYGQDSTVIERVQGNPYGFFRWDEGDLAFNVDSGSHTIDIMQREPGAIVDMIIISSNPNFDPTTNTSWMTTTDPQYEVVYVTPSAQSNDTTVIQAIEAYGGGEVFGVTVLEKSVVDSSDLALLDGADVVIMGRNINSNDVAAGTATWDAVTRPILSMNMYGLRSTRANWISAPINSANFEDDTIVVTGIIQNGDPVFGGLTDTIVWWNGRYSGFTVDSARIAAGNGTLMVESADLRPLFIRWDANEEFYPGAGHQPSSIRSYLGLGIDALSPNPPSYFAFSTEGETIFFNELLRMADYGTEATYQVVYVTPSAQSKDTAMIQAIEAYDGGNVFGVTVLEKSVVDASDLAQFNAADVVIMGRNIGSNDVAAGAAIWDSISKPVLSVNMYGLRSTRANWVPAPIDAENFDGDTVVVNGIIQNGDPVFGGLTDTIVWWNGRYSAFSVDSGRVAAGNGTLMVESADLRPLFIRWDAFEEFYPGAGHEPRGIRSFMGAGIDDRNGNPPSYFAFSAESETIFFNELLRMGAYGAAVDTSTTDTTTGILAPATVAIKLYPNPAHDYVNIVSEVNIQNIRVINVMGTAILTEAVNAKETVLDLTNCSSGVYIVIIEGQETTQAFKLRKR
jgi:hypothetical protein